MVLASAVSAAQLEINPQQSKIEVAVNCTMDSFVGQFEKFQEKIECDPAVSFPTKADVSFDFADLKTGNTNRDAAMLEWLEYPGNPTGSFQLDAWNSREPPTSCW